MTMEDERKKEVKRNKGDDDDDPEKKPPTSTTSQHSLPPPSTHPVTITPSPSTPPTKTTTSEHTPLPSPLPTLPPKAPSSTTLAPPSSSTPANDKSSKTEDLLTSRLREVFDVCDDQSEGSISLEHFTNLAQQFASDASDDDTIKRMVAALDTGGSGRISFDHFRRAVKQILFSNRSELGQMEHKVIEDFINVRRKSADGQQSPEIYETPPSPDPEAVNTNNNNNNNINNCESHNKNHNNNNNNNKNNNSSNNSNNNKSPFDFMASEKAPSNSSEDDVDSGAWSTTQDNFWLSSPPPSSKHLTTLETTPSPLSNGFPSNDFFGSYDNADFDDRPASNNNNNNHFHRKVHSNNTTPRSSFRSSPGSRNGQSYRSGSTINCSESLLDVADSQVYELTDKILKLEDNLTSLNEIQKQNEDKQLKMKEENALMVERVHVLEDQLREIEAMNVERLKEETNKHREIMIKSEKDKVNQIELLSRSLKLVETEYNTLKEATPALKMENEKLKKLNSGLEQEVVRWRQECEGLREEMEALQENVSAEQERMAKERQTRTQLLDDLTQELNELRISKSNLLRASPAFGRNDSDLDFHHTQEKVKHLKKENSDLRAQLEELQALVLSRSVEEGQRLMQPSSHKSLAFEIDEAPKNELVAALRKEQEANTQLKEYIGFITLRILEKNPSILEIKSDPAPSTIHTKPPLSRDKTIPPLSKSQANPTLSRDTTRSSY